MKQITNQYSSLSIAQNILAITMRLNNTYPELARYLTSISMRISDKSKSKVSRVVMQEYYDALVLLMTSYEMEIRKKK